VLDINLNGPFYMTRAVLAGMLARNYGRIVNITSASAVRVGTGVAAYGSSKAGLIALTKSVANEAAAHGVTVNAVAPGLVDTEMMRNVFPTTAALEAIARNSPIANPMGKLLQPEDIAHAVAFLCHPRSWGITGQVLHVNAGAIMP
jgi:NAD(P)-dependent dehydrogenase (short-subunit alcohol dehydrogenase family)